MIDSSGSIVQEKDLPWATPSKALKLDLGNLKNLVGNVEGVDVV